MTTQHTPGPWEILYNDPQEEYWVTRPHYDAGPAKIVYHIEDARLIAAAPDLLEALKEMLDNHEDACTGYGEGAAEKARAAIAKATGGV
jgi:hypothetical protein